MFSLIFLKLRFFMFSAIISTNLFCIFQLVYSHGRLCCTGQIALHKFIIWLKLLHSSLRPRKATFCLHKNWINLTTYKKYLLLVCCFNMISLFNLLLMDCSFFTFCSWYVMEIRYVSEFSWSKFFSRAYLLPS